MNRLLNIYHKLGRWGNIIILILLILTGLFNRLYNSIKYDLIDYRIEMILIALAFYFVYRIHKKNEFTFNNQKLLKFILLCGIIFRIVIGVHDFYNRPVQDSDYEKHELLGERLATEGEFYDKSGIVLRNFRQPGLPAIFAVGLMIYNHPITYAVIMIMFSFGVLISGYYLFRDLNNIAALISFTYLAVSPNMLFMASNSNTQLSFFFFVILLFITMKNYTGKIYQLVLVAIFLAAEMYIRFNFLMVFIMIPFLYEMHRDKSFIYFLGRLSFIYFLALLLYSPWIYRNYIIYGQIRLMPTTGMGLYSSNVTKDYTRLGGYNGVPDSIINKYSHLPEIEFDNALKNEVIEFAKNNPEIYIKGMPFKIMKFSGRQSWTTSYFFDDWDFGSKEPLRIIFESIENYLFWVILFFSLIYLIRIKKFPAISVYILWAYLCYAMVLLPVSETGPRYNFPYILFPMFAISFVKKNEEDSSPVKIT